MNLKTIFKRLILLDLLLIILLVVSVFFESEEVADFNKYFESEFSDSLLIIFGILMLIYLINLFLLYRFISIGKQMYLFIYIVGFVISLLGGPIALDSWVYALDGIEMSVAGALLVLLYFSPIKKEFEK